MVEESWPVVVAAGRGFSDLGPSTLVCTAAQAVRWPALVCALQGSAVAAWLAECRAQGRSAMAADPVRRP